MQKGIGMNNFWIVDTFTPVAFRGNPAAVYLLPEFPDDKELQLLAAQANLSETAFIVKGSALNYDLRWFTPEMEVPLCGHATLAAAQALLHIGDLKVGDVVNFYTLSGELRASILKKTIELNFPTQAGVPVTPPKELKALRVEIIACEKNADKYLVEVKDFNTLLAVRPDFKKLAKLDINGVIVTTATGVDGYDFASRFFAPAIGIDEDPVTGSSHCFLAPYWAKKLGRNNFHAFQASRARGVLDIALAGDRTLISGNSVITLSGTVNLPKNKSKKELPA
jgi:PhzF family phenazine biosynthesis protein